VVEVDDHALWFALELVHDGTSEHSGGPEIDITDQPDNGHTGTVDTNTDGERYSSEPESPRAGGDRPVNGRPAFPFSLPVKEDMPE
jgi:hypothetical protein